MLVLLWPATTIRPEESKATAWPVSLVPPADPVTVMHPPIDALEGGVLHAPSVKARFGVPFARYCQTTRNGLEQLKQVTPTAVMLSELSRARAFPKSLSPETVPCQVRQPPVTPAVAVPVWH